MNHSPEDSATAVAPMAPGNRRATWVVGLLMLLFSLAMGIHFYSKAAVPGRGNGPPDRALVGRVLRADGTPAAVALVHLIDLDARQETGTVTNTLGEFRFDPLKGGHRYQVVAEQGTARSPAVAVPTGESQVVRIELRLAGP